MKLRNIFIIFMICFSWMWPSMGNAQDNAEEQACKIAKEVSVIYGQVSSRNATTKDIAGLLEQLEQLFQMDSKINGSANFVQCYALQYRTLAWIQGWASLSHILSKGQYTFTSEERRQLLSLQDRSVFRLLLEIYRQMWNSQ